MTYNARKFTELTDIFGKIEKSIKRSNASKKKKIIRSREYILLRTYNKIVEQAKHCFICESLDRRNVEEILEDIEDRLEECLKILNSNYEIPIEKYKQIEIINKPQKLSEKEVEINNEISELDEVEEINSEEDFEVELTSDDSEELDTTEIERHRLLEEEILNINNTNNNININNFGESNNNNNINQNNNNNIQNNTNQNKTNKMEADKVIEHLNRIVKDSYDGEPSELETFLNKIKLAKTIIAANHPNIFLAYIISRLTKKALECARSAQTVDEIINLLTNNIKPESSRVLEKRLISIRMDNNKKQEFAKQIEETAEMLRLALISEQIPAERAQEMIKEKVIETCNHNAKSDRIKSVLSAKQFKTVAEITSELFIQIDTVKVEHQINALRISNNHRGNYRNNNRNMRNNGRRFNTRFVNNRNFNNTNRNNDYNRNNFNNRGNNNYRNNSYRGNFNNRGNYNNWRNNDNNNQNPNNNNNRNIRFLGMQQDNNNQDQNNQNQTNQN